MTVGQMTLTERVRRNFSRAAPTYDRYAEVQRECARALVRRVPSDAASVYEIGCGTGLYTRMLREALPAARITAADIAPEMVERAREQIQGVAFMVAAAEQPAVCPGWDLVTSNAALQWVDWDTACMQAGRLLRQRGRFTCTLFGPRTYAELARVAGHHGRGRIAAQEFLDRDELLAGLNRCFSRVSVEEMIRQEIFPSLDGMLDRMRYTGSRAVMSARKGLCTRSALLALEESYRREFGSIRATYQIFVCEARAR